MTNTVSYMYLATLAALLVFITLLGNIFCKGMFW